MEDYTPPRIWYWDSSTGGKFSRINRPFSGERYSKDLPIGTHPLQLYSLATPNGIKVTILLEELLSLGIEDAEYDAWIIDILEGEQFSSGFVELNPHSKVPVLCDQSGEESIRVFESGSILLYLAEKFQRFIPSTVKERTECLNWLFWQMSSAPYLGGGFGHFYHYAPIKIKYAIDRFSMEAKRQLDVLDKHLAKNTYMSGNEYSIADMAIWPWYGKVVLEDVYGSAEFLQVQEYSHFTMGGRDFRTNCREAGLISIKLLVI